MIIWNEIRKVFEFKMVLILFIVSLIMFYLFISFDIKHFPNGRPALDDYNISAKMIKHYGTTLDEKEFKLFKNSLNDDIEAANTYLQSKNEFKEAGITTYQEYGQLSPMNEEEGKLRNLAVFEDNVDAFWEIEAKQSLIEQYENKGHFLDVEGHFDGILVTQRQEKRLQEVTNSGSIFPYVVFDHYNNLISYVCALTLISIMFMISPIFLRDKNNQLIQLQYTTKTGRSLFKKKLVSAVLASFIIITIQLIAFFALYSTNKTWMFFDSNINSVFNVRVFWFNFTFIEYIALSVLAIFILSFFTSIVISLISSLAPNFITVIGLQVPIVFISTGFLIEYLISSLTEIHLPIFFAPVFYAGLIIVALGFIVVRWSKEKHADIII
jgi:hypothetical protein